MSNADPMDILICHDRWANEQVLRACAGLTREQFHRRFEMGPGSLHDTVTHILGAQARWTDVLAGRESLTRLEETERTVAELVEVHKKVAAEFAEQARSKPLTETVTATRKGQTWQFTRGAVVTHVTTHGMHHRAQCLNMLRHVGVTEMPLSSVMEWVRAGEPR